MHVEFLRNLPYIQAMSGRTIDPEINPGAGLLPGEHVDVNESKRKKSLFSSLSMKKKSKNNSTTSPVEGVSQGMITAPPTDIDNKKV